MELLVILTAEVRTQLIAVCFLLISEQVKI